MDSSSPLPFKAPSFHSVVAGLVPAIHAQPRGTKDVDAPDKPGHEDYLL
jgi:hypothetical protein